MADTMETVRAPDKPRGKTRDAFALKIIRSKYLFATSGGEFAEGRKQILDLFNDKEYAIVAKSLGLYKNEADILLLVVQSLNRHLARLTTYSRKVQSHWLGGDLPDDIAKNRIRRVRDLIEAYSSVIDKLTARHRAIERLVEEIGNETGFWERITFSKRLKEARRAANLTQAQVATKIGMQRGGYAQYEIMAREPSLKTLVQLSKILNRSIDWLLGLTP